MTKAQLFCAVMEYLWDGENPSSWLVAAIGQKVRGTAHVNPENAFDVLILAFRDHLRDPMRVERTQYRVDQDGVVTFAADFDDDSSVQIEVVNGIGSSVAPLVA